MSEDLKSPYQKPDNTKRAVQTEEPAMVCVNLTSGRVCSDGYEPLPPDNVEDPNVRIVTKKLSGTSTKPSMIGIEK